jgi:hypothetical protein
VLATKKGYKKVMDGKQAVPNHDFDLSAGAYVQSKDEYKKFKAARKVNDNGYTNFVLLLSEDSLSFNIVWVLQACVRSKLSGNLQAVKLWLPWFKNAI